MSMITNGVTQNAIFYKEQLASQRTYSVGEQTPAEKIKAFKASLQTYKKAWKAAREAALLLRTFSVEKVGDIGGVCSQAASRFIQSVSPFINTEASYAYAIFDLGIKKSSQGWVCEPVSTKIADLVRLLIGTTVEKNGLAVVTYAPEQYKQWQPKAVELVKALDMVPPVEKVSCVIL